MTDAQSQWSAESAFFDAEAVKATPFDLELVARRYEAAMSRPLYPLEVAYSMMGDLRDKRVLDVGCGMGENSLLFARWGAQVTGVDISAGSIALARARAAAVGLGERINFLVMPFETVVDSVERFDIVWSAAFLHHVLDHLNEVAVALRALARAEGTIIVLEPIRLSRWLQRVRALVPPYASGTPDERPLEQSDLSVLRRQFVFKSQRLYGPISRLATRLLMPGAYETAGRMRRHMCDWGHKVDRLLANSAPLMSSAMVLVASLTPN